MATPYIQSMEEYYFWRDFRLKILLKFKASMPLLANFIFRNGRFFVSIESQTMTALKSLFEEMSKIIPWSRCSGDPTSVKCKISLVRTRHLVFSKGGSTVSYGYDEDLIVNWLTAEDRRRRHCVSQAYYIFSSHDFDVFCWFGQNRFKTFTDWTLCTTCVITRPPDIMKLKNDRREREYSKTTKNQ